MSQYHSTPTYTDINDGDAESTHVADPMNNKKIDLNDVENNDDNVSNSRCSSCTELFRCSLGIAILVICGCISVALVIATIVLVYTSVANDNSNIGWVNHTTDVRSNIALLIVSIYQTNQAVSQLIIDPANTTYINQYNTNLGYVNGNFSYFQFLTQDNPVQSVDHVNLFNQIFITNTDSLSAVWAAAVAQCSTTTQCTSNQDKLSVQNTITPPFHQLITLILINPGGTCYGDAASCSILGEEAYLLSQRTYTTTSHFQVSLETASALLAVVVVCILVMAYGLIKRQKQTFEHVKVELTQQVKEARKDAKNKSSFLATMSHELRTPMNGVMAMSELLSLTNLTSYQSDLLSTVRSSASSMMLLVNDLLMHLKIEAGMFRLLPTPFLLNKFLNDVDRLFSLRASSKGLSFSVECSDEVPPILVADADRLRQVIINLCDNALKFTDKGSVHVYVQLKRIGSIESKISETSTRISETSGYMPSPAIQHRTLADRSQQNNMDNNNNSVNGVHTIDITALHHSEMSKAIVPVKTRKYAPTVKRELVKSARETIQSMEHEVGEQVAILQFIVTDTGIGISADAQQKIWLPFQQADANVATKYGGTGLGLSIASDLVQLMGGRMSVTSQLGIGTTFMFTIKCPVQFNTDTSDNDQLPQMNMLLNNIAEASVDRGMNETSSAHGDAPYLTPPQQLNNFNEFGDRQPSNSLSQHSQHTNDPMQAQPIITDQSAGIYDAALAVADDLHLQAQQQTTNSNTRQSRRRTALNFTGPRLHLLLAEDNKTNVKVAINMLKRLANHDITVASNGLEAIELYKSGKYFDAILMDVQMPHCDGNQATREIRRLELEQHGMSNRAVSERDLLQMPQSNIVHGRTESTPVSNTVPSKRIPIVCMSASVMDDDVRRAKASGMDLFLSKPLSLSGLEAMLNQVAALK